MAEKNEKVKIKLPYVPGVLEDDVFVGDNGKTYLIKRGETVEVPASVAEILENAERLEKEGAIENQKLRKNADAKALS
jgi:hypothetical protein